MTGLTDDMRANFNLMKDVNNVLQKPADARFKEIKQFVEDLAAQQKVKEFTAPWKFGISREAVVVDGQMVSAGDIEMGNQRKFPANSDSRVFDRETQNQLYKGIDLKKWAVFCGRNNQNVAKNFVEKMREVSNKQGL